MTRYIRARYGLAGLVAAIVIGFLLVLSSNASTAEAAGLNQGSVVPERPRNDVPVVLDGRVFAHAQVGNRIFVGGDFDRVLDTNGNIINQQYLFAYDINTGQFDQNFRPNLNNDVRALEARTGNDGL